MDACCNIKSGQGGGHLPEKSLDTIAKKGRKENNGCNTI
jgi:hypothetical protein